MDKALVVIDYTNDFVATDGALTCGAPGQALEPYITKLTTQFIDDEQYVVFACDLHEEQDPYHPETALFPPHNIRDTAGRKLYGRLQDVYEAHATLSHVKWMDKTRYSSFAGTELFIRLRERGIQELHLVGVCTDICVLHTAVDAYNLGFRIIIHEQGVASFNDAGHTWALEHFKHSLGATVK
ncbi:cysteine hydrolase family protein [Kurthia huakuii]|uniref:cysteine hydrolase family protein n=1 Tax=Kurthia huakuii TaxID=1421019 RepID=UPI000496C9EE|nr:isochorismatase family cysteine hydrolase [Kurthia huakuii]MBM7698176.1 nicotinamidase-related amidase [Kurthia huakuii]